ncbi:hypothetical protein CK203_092933 [Vitis vinifera]|uniref:Reverse transcriptase domain-containing protein n=1 Tax=Vitis vinifera TaxID=29760 RepID=A0A438EJC9_VITVI|nr:hypothetical protein CK203_092933 [Vitis vinifera]
MTKIFKPLIDQTMEVYIDDIVVKSETRAKHIQHLEEAFRLIQAYNMKFNPAKCAFSISAEKFLGASGSGVGLALQSPIRKLVKQAIHLNFPTSNNEVEYEAMLAGLDLTLMLVVVWLEVRSDSQLIVEQIQREYKAKGERIARYLSMVEELLKKLDD